MASLDDLAALIAHHRAAAEKFFDSEVAKLRASYGSRVVDRALELLPERQSGQRTEISITASRARHEAQRRQAYRR
jgi:hypothetical protein